MNVADLLHASAAPCANGSATDAAPPSSWPSRLWRPLAAGGAGLLLASAFPPLAAPESAWVAFVPLLVVAWLTPPAACWRYGFLSGCVFWLCSLAWLPALGRTGAPYPLAVIGWLALALYCAVYTGLFLYLTAHLARHCAVSGLPSPPVRRAPALRQTMLLALVPLCWVGLEYGRSVLFSGFPWNALGISQYRQIAIIQTAAWGGVYSVSALVMVVNVALTVTGFRFADLIARRRPSRFHPELMVGLLLAAFSLLQGAGQIRLHSATAAQDTPVVARAVQPNIPQVKKWPEEYGEQVYDSLRRKTEMAATGRPDLIVWPETALPDPFNVDPRASSFTRSLAARGAPILAGALELSETSLAELQASEPLADPATGETLWQHPNASSPWFPRYYNSSFLVGADGSVLGVYRKRHLVPFGEYLPLDQHCEFIRRLAPLGFSCAAGRDPTVFNLPLAARPAAGPAAGPAAATETRFAALICFEDVFAYLARDAVRAGARFLANQTNDAWFDGTSAAHQHLSHAVFRCVENRVPMVRAANTGVSGFIDRCGRLDRKTAELVRNGHTDRAEIRTERLRAPGPDMAWTFYTRHGDRFFAQPAAAAVALSLIGLLSVHLRKRRYHGRPSRLAERA